MGLWELVMMTLLLRTDAEPQGASLFNQDSIIELINLVSPEGRCLLGLGVIPPCITGSIAPLCTALVLENERAACGRAGRRAAR